jgi:hypothetical protein
VTGHSPPDGRRPTTGNAAGRDTSGRADLEDIVRLTSDEGAFASQLANDLHRRRLASLRCEPLEDGADRRDPMDLLHPRVNEPATFGMDIATLRAEARRCWDSGWAAWELYVRFDLEAA